MISEIDLNLCQQVKDKWLFQMTSRYSYYAEFLNNFIRHDFEPQVIRDPSLDDVAPPKAKKQRLNPGEDQDSF